MVYEMREEIMFRMTRPEDGERGLGASHRRGGTGRASYRRPPEDRRSEGLVKALVRVESPTSKAPGAERKVESMRDKRAKRAASGKLHIDDGCMGGGEGIECTEHLYYDPNEYWSLKDGTGDWDTPRRKDGSNNDFYDYKFDSNYFDPDRKGIFHYCIIASYIDVQGFDTNGVAEVNGPGGDDFTVGKSEISGGLTAFTKVWMHEFGHNLGLVHVNNKNTVMYGSGAENAKCIDYLYSGWKDVSTNLKYVINTVD